MRYFKAWAVISTVVESREFMSGNSSARQQGFNDKERFQRPFQRVRLVYHNSGLTFVALAVVSFGFRMSCSPSESLTWRNVTNLLP